MRFIQIFSILALLVSPAVALYCFIMLEWSFAASGLVMLTGIAVPCLAYRKEIEQLEREEREVLHYGV